MKRLPGFRVQSLLICSCALFLGILLAPSASAAFRYLQEGMEAPTVTGKDILTGEKVSSDDTGDSNIVIIMFWATWSERSMQELTDLKALYEEYPEYPFTVIAVNVENQTVYPETRALIAKTITDLDLPFPVIVDDGLELFYQYGVIAVPSTAVLDTLGTLRYGPAGYSLTTRDRIVDTIEVLLGLREAPTDFVLVQGYVPVRKASRYYQLGLQLANKRMYERAKANVITAIDADSNFSAPHNLLGDIHLELDSVAAAVREFEIAVHLDSNSVAAWAGWGRALLRAGEPDKAIDKLSVALRHDPSFTPAMLDLALALAEKQDTRQALDSLMMARDLNPLNPKIHYSLGKVYRMAKQDSAAAASFRAGLEIFFPSP